MDDPVLTLAEAALYLRLAEQTLYSMRYENRGPRSTKAGRRVVYRKSWLDEYLEANASSPLPRPAA